MGSNTIWHTKAGQNLVWFGWKDARMAAASVANWLLCAPSIKVAWKPSNTVLNRKGVWWFDSGSKQSSIEIINHTSWGQNRRCLRNIFQRLACWTASLDSTLEWRWQKSTLFMKDCALQGHNNLLRLYYSGRQVCAGQAYSMFWLTSSRGWDKWSRHCVADCDCLQHGLWRVVSGRQGASGGNPRRLFGVQRKLPVKAHRALAAYLIYAGIFLAIMARPGWHLHSAGGGKGTGLGNKLSLCETMEG